MEYHEQQLSKEEQEFYQIILQAVKNRETEAANEKVQDIKTLLKIMKAMDYDHPELFYVNFRHASSKWRGSKYIYCPEYLYDEKETEQIRKQLNIEVQKVIQQIKSRNPRTVYNTCIAIHDYLIRNCTFDHNDYPGPDYPPQYYTDHTVVGVFIKRIAVCQGLSMAFRVLGMLLGIDVICVYGKSFDSDPANWIGHAWNMVRLGNEYAQIDVTYDLNRTEPGGPIRYDHFFLPDIEMLRDHQYLGYPVCRRMNMSFMERAGLCFDTMDKLEEYVRLTICKYGNYKQNGTYYLYLKYTDRSLAVDEIKQNIHAFVHKYTHNRYSWELYTKSAQYIFFMKLQIGNAAP